MSDTHLTQQRQADQLLYQHHIESFQKLNPLYVQQHAGAEEQEHDKLHKDNKHSFWGKSYVSKLKDKAQSMTLSDRERLKTKERLGEIIENDSKSMSYKKTPEFGDVLRDIMNYTKMNANAVQGDYEAEQAALLTAQRTNMKFIIEMQIKQHEEGLSEEEDTLLKRAFAYNEFFMTEQDGVLQIPDRSQVKSVGDSDIACEKEYKDRKAQVLFPHEPCVNDISQGTLGDCYLLAGLSAVVNKYPMKIKECMRDNGNGTVTVRFYENVKDAGSPVGAETYHRETVYVSVTKTTPDEYAENSLWVQLIEKAYTASKIHKPDKPADYKNIDGGFSGAFITALLGEEYQAQTTGYSEKTFNGAIIAQKQFEELINTINGGAMQENAVVRRMLENDYGYTSEPTEENAKKEYATTKAYISLSHNSLLLKIENEISEVMHDAEDGNISMKDIAISALNKRLSMIGKSASPKLVIECKIIREFMSVFNGVTAQVQCHSIPKPLTGVYNELQLNEFEHIKTAFADGKIITAATMKFNSAGTGMNGETVNDGIYGEHAYTVLGTETRTIADKQFHFVKLRNPWGKSIEQYVKESGSSELKKEKEETGNSGIFLCELGRFCSVYDTISFN